MNQNRQATKDRLEAQQDYEVNLKAELEVLALHTKLDALQQEHCLLRQVLEQQAELLKDIHTKLAPDSTTGIEQ